MKEKNNQTITLEQNHEITVTEDYRFLWKEAPQLLEKIAHNPDKKLDKLAHIKFLKEKIKEYPDIAFLHKMLVDEYTLIHNDNLHAKYTLVYYEKFPDDFFAKLNIARIYLEQNEYKNITRIYGKDLSLRYAFPDRKEFHSAEIVDFLYFVIRYHLTLMDIEKAEKARKKVGELNADEEFVAHMDEMIQYYKEELAQDEEITLSLSYSFKQVYTSLGIPDEEIDLLEEYRDIIHKLEEPAANVVVALEVFINKYPDNPYFKLFIIDYHIKIKNSEAAIEHINILYNSHPDFLMSKIKMVQLLLNGTFKNRSKKQLGEDAVKIFDNILDFQYVKPQRELYHIDEALMFYFVVLQIHIRFNRPAFAQNCLAMIGNLDPNSKEYAWGKKILDDYNRNTLLNSHN